VANNPGITAWHAYMAGADRTVLADLIAEEAVFHSPVVHTPQAGKALVMAYLGAAAVVFGNDSFRYVREIAAGDSVMLEFEVLMDGVHVNGVDIIRFDASNRIVDFKVMVRPLKAINKVWELMAAQLQAAR
jgi:predicted SnoaL-like aldol condensation-catalyzing enzyme